MAERRLVVVGGGVAGLAGARAARLGAERAGLPLRVTVLEASPRLGGKVWTEESEGEVLEWGPDSFLARKPRGRDLAEELGLGDALVAPGPAAARAYLLLGGRLRELPRGTVMGVAPGPGALLAAVREGVLSPRGALRAAVEPLLPALPPGDRSVDDLARRRLGEEAARRLVGPLVGGVYGAPAGEVSAAAALPDLAGARSLVLAARRAPRGRGPVFLSLRGGMGRLVEPLAGSLVGEGVHTGRPALALAGGRRGYRVATPAGEVEADAVLLAVPPAAAAALLRPVAPEAARGLAAIRSVPSAVVHLAYPAGALGRPLDAAGYLAAGGEPAAAAACSWLNAKWPHLGLRRPRLRAVVTDPAALAEDDDALARRVEAEVSRILRARAPAEDVRLRRWDPAMPVHAPGHRERAAAIRRALPQGLAVAGAALDGVGVPDCAGSGEREAARLVAALA